VTVAADHRAVDPIAYIRAIGLAPQDSYGFVPLDLHDACSYGFIYRDRPEYAQARDALPPAERIGGVDFGLFDLGFGKGRAADVEVPAEGPSPRTAGFLGQVQALQQQYADLVPQPDPLQQLQALRDQGVLDEAEFAELAGQVQGGHAGPSPGGVPAAPAAPDAPPIVVHRLYPRIDERSTQEQLAAYLPAYVQAVGLCPEDVYGVWPRRTRLADRAGGVNDPSVWDDYWIIYRDRPEYAPGRDAYAAEMSESRGLFASLRRSTWPEPEIVPGVAGPAAGSPAAGIRVDDANDVVEAIARTGLAPEDSFGCCPDFNQRRMQLARRTA
jgi:hypothetical protein